VQFGGKQRNTEAFRVLFQQAGLRLVDIFATQSHFKIIDGRPERVSKDNLV
jgi:hypothetical protein